MESQDRQALKPNDDEARLAQDFVRTWFSNRKDSDFATLVRDLGHLRDATTATVAECFGTRVKTWISEQQTSAYREKQALAGRLNQLLIGFGLAFRCPKTGLDGFLVVEPNQNAGEGRFRLLVRDPTARRAHRRTLSSTQFPNLDLRSLSLSPEAEVEWVSRARPKKVDNRDGMQWERRS